MIPNPAAATVLCFGDSNTNGVPSDDPEYVRLASDVRWTGRLQRLLGDGFAIIEEGLSGRTTDLEYDDRPGCNGRPYFVPCLHSHQPLDVVIIMLGSNDLKTQFDRSPAAIAAALGGYVDEIEANALGTVPKAILISPIHLDDTRPQFADVTGGLLDGAAAAMSRLLAGEIRRVAQARGVHFADAAMVAHAGGDGIHLSLDSHEPLAALLATTIRGALSGAPPR